MGFENDSTAWADMAAQQPELNEREKALRDLFVDEYLKDYDPYRAALRCGFMASFAKEYAARFMSEPYVQKRISELGDTLLADEETQRKRTLQALIREAHYTGPGSSHAARVSALSKLAHILKMEPEKDSGAKGNGVDGGVMMVPEMTDPDSWSEMAEKSQQTLKETVKE